VELVPEGVPSYAVEEEINVILKADQKIFLNVTLGPVQNGKQGNGASVLSRAGVDRNNVGSNAADRTSHVIQPGSRHRQQDVNLVHALNGKLGSGACAQ